MNSGAFSAASLSARKRRAATEAGVPFSCCFLAAAHTRSRSSAYNSAAAAAAASNCRCCSDEQPSRAASSATRRASSRASLSCSRRLRPSSGGVRPGWSPPKASRTSASVVMPAGGCVREWCV